MKPNQIPLQIQRISRNAFTLVELMVAMALILLMLSIMSQAFVIATGTMQGLKEVADMQEKIRPAITLLQRDLGANHFEGSKKLSDPEFWDNGPPKEGYFMLWQDNAFEPAIPGVEPSGKEEAFPQIVQIVNPNIYVSNGVSFSRSAARANHMLAFTVKLPGKSPSDFFEENLALPILRPIKLAFGNTFFNVAGTPQGMTDSNIRRFESTSDRIHSDWGEVAYFLGPHTVAPDGYTDGKAAPALPYFSLYRQQRLVLPSYNIDGVNVPLLDPNLGIIPANAIDNNPNLDANLNPKIATLLANDYFSGLSYHLNSNSKVEFNKPTDLTVPWKRLGNRTNVVNTPVTPPTSVVSNLANFPKHYLGYPQTNMTLFSEYSSAAKVNTDIIATNVISFDVKLLTDLRYDYEDLATILSQSSYSNYPPVNNYGSPNPRVFDTWTTDQGNAANTIPKYDFGYWNNITGKWQPSGNNAGNNSLIPVWNVTNNTGLNIKAIQISLRVWDQKSNTAKMFVIVQKL